MRRFFQASVLLSVAVTFMGSTISPSGDGANGWATGDNVSANNMTEFQTGSNENSSRLDAILSTNACTSPPCDLTSGTTIGSATPIFSTATTHSMIHDRLLTPDGSEDHFIAKNTGSGSWTVTAVNCITTGTGTVTVTLKEYGSTGVLVGTVEAAITCDSDGAAHSGGIDAATIESGNLLYIDFGTATDVDSLLTTVTVLHSVVQ